MIKFKRVYLFSLLAIQILVGLGVFLFQEKLIFKPTKLSHEFLYQFSQPFEEMRFSIGQNEYLHGILFSSENSKGVVLYFHGNQGKLNEIGKGANVYTAQNFDILYLNYRGYGKSDGEIKSENQLFADAQIVYDDLKTKYAESKIILAGISVGTGIATYIASKNNPKSLKLIAPYSSFENLLNEKMKWVPSLVWKYELNTIEFLTEVKCPVTIFHGEDDRMIPIHHAELLKDNFPKIKLVSFKGYGHTNFLKEEIFKIALSNSLDEL
jgi:alpha-beta hydrolase superfamily lysophospholipase